MTKLRQRKRWFTMVEVLVVLILTSTTFMWIISAVISTTNYLTATRQKVTALNLAKEWVEVMYNIRNSNRRRRANQRDSTWLKADPLAVNADETPVDERIYPWKWVIKTKTGDNNKYFTLKRRSDWWDMSWENELQRSSSKLQEAIYWGTYLTWAYKLHFLSGNWYNNDDLDSFDWEEILVWEYRRYIAVDWLYSKLGGNNVKIHCPNSTTTDIANWIPITCWDDTAKELRFCSVVVYTRPKFWTVEICAIMTNFEK